ncbi:hypothetical protein EPO15_12665 [bacterium]|nr:MAG: hypothetical protein EPO15_12665 [bacterium]
MRLLGAGRAPGTAELRQLKRLAPAWAKARTPLAVLGTAVLLAVPAWVWGVGWWMDFSDEPVPSDFLVVLAGDFSRPFAGAELYKQGVSDAVWYSKPWRPFGLEEVLRKGLKAPTEEEIDKAIFLSQGVPEGALRLYGDLVISTFAEARAFKAAAKPEGKTVMVVTSRFHARRAKLIFSTVLRDSTVRVYGAKDPDFTRRWWTSQPMAYAAILESCKLAYWLAGGRFLTARQG